MAASNQASKLPGGGEVDAVPDGGRHRSEATGQETERRRRQADGASLGQSRHPPLGQPLRPCRLRVELHDLLDTDPHFAPHLLLQFVDAQAGLVGDRQGLDNFVSRPASDPKIFLKA